MKLSQIGVAFKHNTPNSPHRMHMRRASNAGSQGRITIEPRGGFSGGNTAPKKGIFVERSGRRGMRVYNNGNVFGHVNAGRNGWIATNNLGKIVGNPQGSLESAVRLLVSER